MPPQPAASAARRRWGRLALATAVTAWLLVVLGGWVRITGSGMGCGPDWPLCHGELIPLMDLPTFLEWSHRVVAAFLSAMLIGAAAVAWWPGRGPGWRRARRLSAAAVAVLAVQVMLGAVTVWLELPPTSVVLHLGTAMVLLAVLLIAGTLAVAGPRSRLPDGAARTGWLGAGAGFAVVLLGALVANLQAAPSCQGFPLCNGSFLPAGGWRIQLHWLHRLSAYALVGWCLWLPRHVGRRRPGDPAARRAALAAAAVAVGQLAVGAAMVLGGLPSELRALHLALGAGLFGLLAVTAVLVSRPPAPDRESEAAPDAATA